MQPFQRYAKVTNAAGGGVSRAEQDAFAIGSHRKAARAWKDGLFAHEVVAVTVPQQRGDPEVVTRDEGIRTDVGTTSLASLRPSFRPDGTINSRILLTIVGRRRRRGDHQSADRRAT